MVLLPCPREARKKEHTVGINHLTIQEQHGLLKKKEIKPSQLVSECVKAYEESKDLNAYLEFFEDAKDRAAQLDGQQPQDHPLWAIPGAIKDNIAMKDRKMTCASKILENFVSPYNATVIKRLQNAEFINLGRLNHDEFAIGASGFYSAFGPTLNPLDRQRFPGGSSSGSAVAVAAGLASFALGTDTGGSCRLPASYCGVYGFKPTYGTIPRDGVAEYAPSLDTVGILARCPLDIDYVYQQISGKDIMDESSRDPQEYFCSCDEEVSLKGLKVAVFRRLLERCHPAVQQAFQQAYDVLKSEGAEFKDVELDVEDILLNTYYVTACSEASSSLSRYDGARYGMCLDAQGKTIERLYAQTRTSGFGHEVQRRILLGNFFLAEQNYQQWYAKALSIRQHLADRSEQLAKEGFCTYLLPGFNEAQKIDASEEDTYSSDLVGVFANLMGVPALALPLSSGRHGLPVSFQLSGARGSDRRVLGIGQQLYLRLKKS